MVDRPIIFSAPMVRALLEGRKTQARRLASSPLAKALPGDRLWVRESALFWINTADHSLSHVAAFMADSYELESGERWRPSIHMPRWASRLTLVVTEARHQRLQEISEEDASAEGLDWIAPTWGVVGIPGTWRGSARHSYFALWDHLHGADSWAANPEVIALTFAVHRVNIDQLSSAS